MSDHEKWMQLALQLAERAEAVGEVPVGAVIVLNGELIGSGWNQPISSHDCCAHAEIVALRQACQSQQNYRLPGADIYVTLEPCMMCAGALVHARIRHLYYATPEPKTGAAGSNIDLFSLPNLNHRVAVTGGILAEPSRQLLQQFFRAKRLAAKSA